MQNYVAPPDHLLISKVFYLGSTSLVTGSEWVQIYNPTPITVSLSAYKLGDQAVPGSTGSRSTACGSSRRVRVWPPVV